jgi:hypothetical protein
MGFGLGSAGRVTWSGAHGWAVTRRVCGVLGGGRTLLVALLLLKLSPRSHGTMCA